MRAAVCRWAGSPVWHLFINVKGEKVVRETTGVKIASPASSNMLIYCFCWMNVIKLRILETALTFFLYLLYLLYLFFCTNNPPHGLHLCCFLQHYPSLPAGCPFSWDKSASFTPLPPPTAPSYRLRDRDDQTLHADAQLEEQSGGLWGERSRLFLWPWNILPLQLKASTCWPQCFNSVQKKELQIPPSQLIITVTRRLNAIDAQEGFLASLSNKIEFKEVKTMSLELKIDSRRCSVAIIYVRSHELMHSETREWLWLICETLKTWTWSQTSHENISTQQCHVCYKKTIWSCLEKKKNNIYCMYAVCHVCVST